MKYKIKRKKSIVKYLSEEFGKTWKYVGPGYWKCDDDKRTVMRVASCLCDGDCNHFPSYFLYGDGTPKQLWL